MARLRFPVWLMGLMLVMVTIAIYWPATRCDFVNYDDPYYVTANSHVQGGLNLAGVKWAFFNSEVHFGYWHPLTLLSHMMDCQFFGLKPWGHHLTSVLLHAVNTLLVFLLLHRLTSALWRSVLVAALFGLHPMHVESVAWVAERKDVLSTCFGLLVLLFYVRYVQKATSGGWRVAGGEDRKPSVCVHPLTSVHYWLALLFFTCGLMSKPMLVTWPFVMLLLDYWPLHRFQFCTPKAFGATFDPQLSLPIPAVPSVAKSILASLRLLAGPAWTVFALNSGSRHSTLKPKLSTIRRLVIEKIPFFALATMASVVTFVVSKRGGAVNPLQNLPLGARSGNALISYCRYLEKLFWSRDLAFFYPHPGYWPMEKVLLAGGLLLGISVFFVVKRRRYPFLLMGWLWYCGMLVPAIGLVQVGEFAMADRYTYIPSLGVLILAIWGAYELTRRWRYHMIALSVAGAAAIVLCLAVTQQQIGYWQDSATLFRHALAVTKDNHIAHNSLGVDLLEKGQLDEAIRQYQEAIRLKPDYAEAHNNLGATFGKKGQIDEAISQFREALRLKPDDAKAHSNLGTALGRKGQIDGAISQFQEAIRLRPNDAEACNNLGAAFLKKGQIDEAIGQFREVLRLKPDDAEARNNLQNALLQKGKSDRVVR